MRTFGIFKEIERLIEYIPIESEDHQGGPSSSIDNVKLAKGVSIDSKFCFNDIDGVATRLGIIEVVIKVRNNKENNNDDNNNNNPTSNTINKAEDNYNNYYYATIVSFRDIIKLLNKFLKDASIEELVTTKQHYRYLTQPIQAFDLSSKGILFDFCLAAMEGDTLNAKLYLRHASYLLGLHPRLYLLLCVIINESSLVQDKDIREFLTLLAVITEPNNIDIHFNPNHGGFSKRYDMYLKQLQILTPIDKQKINKTTLTNSSMP